MRGAIFDVGNQWITRNIFLRPADRLKKREELRGNSVTRVVAESYSSAEQRECIHVTSMVLKLRKKMRAVTLESGEIQLTAQVR